jgi:hypothetical protein
MIVPPSFGSAGLVGVRDDHLVAMLRAVHRGELECPFDARALATAGFLGISDRLSHLRGLDRQAVIAVITAVLAERRAATPRSSRT